MVASVATTSGGNAATVVLVVYAVLAGYDGVNLHLVRYRLWERPDSRGEHLLHTARSVAFRPSWCSFSPDDRGCCCGWASQWSSLTASLNFSTSESSLGLANLSGVFRPRR